MFVVERVPRLQRRRCRESYRFDVANGRGAVLELSKGMEPPIRGAHDHRGTSSSECRDRLAQGEREQARAKQHKAGCGYREESFSYEIFITHDAPADRDTGPNLLKLSESFFL
jgi:hypothetical protein